MTDAEVTAIYDRLVADACEGCCLNEAWRGRMCQYHSGYAVGVDVTLQAMTPKVARLRSIIEAAASAPGRDWLEWGFVHLT